MLRSTNEDDAVRRLTCAVCVIAIVTLACGCDQNARSDGGGAAGVLPDVVALVFGTFAKRAPLPTGPSIRRCMATASEPGGGPSICTEYEGRGWEALKKPGPWCVYATYSEEPCPSTPELWGVCTEQVGGGDATARMFVYRQKRALQGGDIMSEDEAKSGCVPPKVWKKGPARPDP